MVIDYTNSVLEWQRVTTAKSTHRSSEHSSEQRKQQQGVRPEDVGRALIDHVFHRRRYP